MFNKLHKLNVKTVCVVNEEGYNLIINKDQKCIALSVFVYFT